MKSLVGRKILYASVLQLSIAREGEVQWKEYDGLWSQTGLGSNPSPATHQLRVLGQVRETGFLFRFLPVKWYFSKGLKTKTWLSAWHTAVTVIRMPEVESDLIHNP